MALRKIKYGMIGASGRLGSEVKNVLNEAGHELVFQYDIDGEQITDKPEILIDCSLPDVFVKTIAYQKSYQIPLIVATTGLTEQQLDQLKGISINYPVVQSYNYSIGIQVLLKLSAIAFDKLKDWDIEITETHHRFKKDKPSVKE